MDNPPKIANPEDIDPRTADAAFNGTSFSPERRGYLYREDYANAVNNLYAALWPHARTDEQKTLLAAEMERYRQGHRRRLLAWLGAHGQCMSPMIAGPSNFPTRRNEKRFRTADKRWQELSDWTIRAQKSIKRKLLDVRPSEDAKTDAFLAITRDIARSLAVIASIDKGATCYTRSSFVNSIVGKLERLAKNGQTSLVRKAIDWLRDHNYPNGPGTKPAITARSKVWALADVAQETETRQEETAAKGPELVAKSKDESVELWTDPQDDRVRLMFPDKPPEDLRRRLKSSGWRWSPTAGAWQRKLTENAVYAGKQILETL